MSGEVKKPLLEQAAIQAGLAFFYTVAGIFGSNPIVGMNAPPERIILSGLIAAGLAFFIKLSVGTGGSTIPPQNVAITVTPQTPATS